MTSRHAAPARRVLVLSRNYPNAATPRLGLWVREIVRHAADRCEQIVVAPVPYSPPLPRMPEEFARFRRVERHRVDADVEIFHPRFVVAPGTRLAATEAVSYHGSVAPLVRRLRRRFPFDLIHAHFSYPDGVVGAMLARRYGVPLVVTEQAPYGPWLESQPLVRRQTFWAARNAKFHIAISSAVRDSIAQRTGSADNVRVIPDGVDGDLFVPAPPGTRRDRSQILFVGVIRPVKGVDVLLEAMRQLVERGHDLRLILVGEGHYRAYRREQDRLEEVARNDPLLAPHVEFVGAKPIEELVRLLQTSALLVLPSRAESLGMVLVEALACGTPVVATRCGGPEDIVTDGVGELVEPDDAAALAAAIGRVLDRPDAVPPEKLRAHALNKFGVESVVERVVELYDEACVRTSGCATALPSTGSA